MAGFGDVLVVEDDDLFAPADGGEPVDNEQGGPPGAQPLQRLGDGQLGLRVDGGEVAVGVLEGAFARVFLPQSLGVHTFRLAFRRLPRLNSTHTLHSTFNKRAIKKHRGRLNGIRDAPWDDARLLFAVVGTVANDDGALIKRHYLLSATTSGLRRRMFLDLIDIVVDPAAVGDHGLCQVARHHAGVQLEEGAGGGVAGSSLVRDNPILVGDSGPANL